VRAHRRRRSGDRSGDARGEGAQRLAVVTAPSAETQDAAASSATASASTLPARMRGSGAGEKRVLGVTHAATPCTGSQQPRVCRVLWRAAGRHSTLGTACAEQRTPAPQRGSRHSEVSERHAPEAAIVEVQCRGLDDTRTAADREEVVKRAAFVWCGAIGLRRRLTALVILLAAPSLRGRPSPARALGAAGSGPRRLLVHIVVLLHTFRWRVPGVSCSGGSERWRARRLAAPPTTHTPYPTAFANTRPPGRPSGEQGCACGAAGDSLLR